MKKYWYKNGLHFSCIGCGRCCSSYPGYVWLSSIDIKKIYQHLQISKKEFLQKYTFRNKDGRISLKEKFHSYACIFYNQQRCSIYTARPVQCRTFPFWQSILASKKEWQKLTTWCPGTNTKSSFLPFEKIQKNLVDHLQSLLLIDFESKD